MKYIDEKRMRFGYIGLFVTSVLLIGAAFWDYTYNDEALINWFISALGGLLLIAIFFFVATELILKDALDLRPKRIAAATDEDHGLMPAHNTLPTPEPSRTASKASMPADSAASMSMMDRPAPNMQRPSNDPAAGQGGGNDWHPHVQAPVTKPSVKKEIIKIDLPKIDETPAKGPTLSKKLGRAKVEALPRELTKIEAPKRSPPKLEETKKDVLKIELPEAVTIHAKPKEASLSDVMPESPATVPKPKNIPAAPRGLHVQSLAYELGSSQFRVPRGSKGHRNPNAVLESTRVLCGDCGLYFRVDLDRARPMSVQCPQCSKDLGLSGARLDADHVKMRCRFCGDFLQMPRVADHKSTQCATCGQING